MDAWTKIGTVAAVVAAVGAVITVLVSWRYGRRGVAESERAILYDRLREARELVGRIRLTGDNTRWNECGEACAQLRTVLVTIPPDLPQTLRLASTTWNLDNYDGDLGLQQTVQAARAELEAAAQQAIQ
jgi:hypothetical protein